MGYGLGWQADGDLGFSLSTSLGGVGLNIARVNAGSDYSMGLSATMDLGGGMTPLHQMRKTQMDFKTRALTMLQCCWRLLRK